MNNRIETNRRLFLVAGSASAGFASLGHDVAAEAEDPIFAAIDRHKAAREALNKAYDLTSSVLAEEQGREVTEDDKAALNAAEKADWAAHDAIVSTAPTTTAGVLAALQYLARYHWQGEELVSFIDTLGRSPVFAGPENTWATP